MPNNALAKLRASIGASRRIANRDRRADFNMADAGLDSIFSNLLTTQQGVSQSLSAEQARLLGGMERLAARGTRGSVKGVAKASGRARNLFGSAMGSVIENQMAPAAATARATGTAARGEVGAGRLLAQGASSATGIQEAAVSEAQAGADYQMAQALQYRAQDDAELVAQQRMQLAQLKADQAANERYLRLQNRLSNGGQGGEGLQNAISSLSELALDPDVTADMAARFVKAASLQYNLGPAAKEKLQAAYDALYEGGVSGATDFPTEQKQMVYAAVKNTYLGTGEGAATRPTDDDALALLGLKKTDKGWEDGEGNVMPAAYIEQVLNYWDTVWNAFIESWGNARP